MATKVFFLIYGLKLKKKEIRDILSGDYKLGSKKELIKKFIEENLPYISNYNNLNEELFRKRKIL
ncbi:hypothetical protein [Elizabethkingia bruuniana]|uniref:hypothetical protein n=1 Tax=Elizabethkingia bruuniana TaxID=1756149 RepID=UPI00241C947F|nr:hypothetical protein [Elizabethkingia bruuniana]